MSDHEILLEEWQNYRVAQKSAVEIAKKELEQFLNKFPKDGLDELTLDKYTNLIKNEQHYLTYYVETKTKKCGGYSTGGRPDFGVQKDKESEKYKIQKQLYLKKDAEKKYADKIRPEIISVTKWEDVQLSYLGTSFAKKLGYLYNPSKSIPIFRQDVIEKMAVFFKVNLENAKPYKHTEHILNKLIELKFISDEDLDETTGFETTILLMNFLWKIFGMPPLVKHINTIYFGAPGTGKTYTVIEDINMQILMDGDEPNEVLEKAQFHPSYSYEDFIDGLKPVMTDNGSIALKLQSGRFKQLCKKAADNLKQKREEGNEPTKFYFFADEINRAELSRVLGEVLVCLEDSKRLDFDESGNPTEESFCLKTQYSHLDSTDQAVLTNKDGQHYFGVPSNLYFIGTMNDIDRSIDSFDLALRRRFVWIEMKCNYDVIKDAVEQENQSEDEVNRYINLCKELNSKISGDWGLGSTYEIGHAYFMKVGKLTQVNLNELFDLRIAPLLKEYLRAEYSTPEIEIKLKAVKDAFSLKEKNTKEKQPPSGAQEEKQEVKD